MTFATAIIGISVGLLVGGAFIVTFNRYLAHHVANLLDAFTGADNRDQT